MAQIQHADESLRRPNRSTEAHPSAAQPLVPESQTAAQGVFQLQQTAGNRAVQRLVGHAAPSGVISRHITPEASVALGSLSTRLATMVGTAFAASAAVENLGSEAAIATLDAANVQAGSNPPMPGEEIPVPATAGM